MVLAVYLLFSVACFFTVHEYSIRNYSFEELVTIFKNKIFTIEVNLAKSKKVKNQCA